MTRFARFAWGLLAYDIGVAAWGAYVRATGSGAGCGKHWPLCNGEVIPQAPRVETMVELSHRVSSGAALLLTAGLLVWSWQAYPRGHCVRSGALAAMAVYAKAVAMRFASGEDTRTALVARAFEFAASLAVLAFGLVLLLGARGGA